VKILVCIILAALTSTPAMADVVPMRPAVGEKPFGYLRQPAAGDRTFVSCPDQRTIGYVTATGTFTIDGRRVAEMPLPTLLLDLCKKPKP